MAVYNPKSLKAEEFINHEEILETIEYAEKNKHNVELIDSLLEKARPKKNDRGVTCAGLTHREASVLLACDIPEKVDFFDALPDYDLAFYTNKKSKTDAAVSLDMLQKVLPKLEALNDWSTDGIHDMLIAFAEELGVKNATLMWPLRIACAGKLVTPGGAIEICKILGKDETIRRVKHGIEKLGG